MKLDRVVLALVALAASVAGLPNDFVYDDIPLVLDNARIHGLAHWRDFFTQAYWPPPFVEQLYRPMSVAFLAVEYTIGDGRPLIFRLVSYGLYVASVLAVFGLVSRLASRRAAFVAAVLFAADPVHVEAVALAVNQSELIVGTLAALTLCFYLDRRRAGELSVRDWTVLAAFCATAALVKENGFVLPALLMAAELLAIGASATRPSPVKRWLPYVGLVMLDGCLLLLRGLVLAGDAVGAVAAKPIRELGMADRMLTMLQVVPQWLRLLVWPARLQVDYGPPDIVLPPQFGPRAAVGLVLLLLVVVAIYATRRRAPVVCFGLAWCAIALLPVSNIIPSGVLLAERTLFLPSIGAAIAVGALVESCLARWPTDATRRALVAACAVLTILGVVRSVSRHLVWNTAHLRIVPRPGFPT